MASSFVAETLPILKIKADNNYDVGFKIGRFYEQISTESNTANKMKLFYESKKGKTMFDDFLAKTTESYPNIVDELRGMADGSGQTFDQLFLNSIISEITLTSAMLKKSEPHIDEVAGCTDVLLNTDQCRLLAHNEDWTTDASKNAFFIDVEVDRSTNKQTEQLAKSQHAINDVLRNRNERFCSFVFPGELAGSTFAMNKHFAFTINSLVPRNFNEGSIILFVLLRALMGCETIEECVQVMEGKPFGCSYGININVASVHSADMWSVEVYPDEGATIVHSLHLPQQITASGCSHYVHTNHYKHIPNVDEEDILEGSKAREFVASAAPVPTCVEDVCKILGDRSSEVQPIYRLPTIKRNVVTAASAVFDFNAKKLYIYLGNPSIAENMKMTVPFIE